jgi:hypothetical protein
VFKPFAVLEKFDFRMASLRDFFHKIGIGWTEEAVSENATSFSELEPLFAYDTWKNEDNYAYPDVEILHFR